MALREHDGRRRRICCALSLVAALAIGAAGAGSALADETLTVVLDQAKVIRIPERTTTVVVGNPLIADISVQSGGMMVVTGKGYGVTNLIALDARGNTLMEQSIEVRGATENVVAVYRGVERESYSCTPQCERRITLGDAPTFFDSTLQQAGSRAGQAQGAGAPPSGGR
jgi:Flp pilus assembly secretin CpaC